MINKDKQQGLSIVEVLIAVAISTVLMAGVLQVFVSNKATYRMTSALTKLQENARFAVDFLVEDIRNVGFWGCAPSRDLIVGTNFSTALAGANDVAVSGQVNTDTITLVDLSRNPIPLTSETTGAAVVVGSATGITAGSHLLITDCSKGELIEVASISGSTLTATTAITKNFQAGALVYQIRVKQYSIQAGSDGPSLFIAFDLNGDGDFADTGESAQEFIQGIEDLQILYGEDTDTDNVANYFVPAGTSGLNMDQVNMVNISLVARTLDDVASSSRTYAGVSDKRLTKQFVSTIAIRNRY